MLAADNARSPQKIPVRNLTNSILNFTESLTPQSLAHGAACLAEIDPDLAWLLSTYGLPPMWDRRPGFPTLVHIILEQQVSLASARAAFDKLKRLAEPLTPGTFLQLSDQGLKAAGFSRQKMGYCRGLAKQITAGELDLAALSQMETDAAREELLKVRGIGPWTADIYLLMALLRPDVWPAGDLALAVALQELKGLASRPNPETLHQMAHPWRPWRAVAARLLWHYYLS